MKGLLRKAPRVALLMVAMVFASWVTESAAQAQTILKVADQKGNARAGLEAAGLLTDLPYEIKWSEFPAAAPLLEAASAGAIDTGTVGDAPFTFATAAGAPIKAVVASRSGQEGLAVVVRGDSPAHAFKDLVGKKIGTGRARSDTNSCSHNSKPTT
jgi:sulfonate transport system substrate-binding protein